MNRYAAVSRAFTNYQDIMQPSFGAKRMVGASGASLTVIGELRRCPVLLNGYRYHVNLAVAELDTVDAILGMDFLTAYGVTINLFKLVVLTLFQCLSNV